MAQKLFKGFMQVTEGSFAAENGYIYFVRNSANTGATDGYLQFNGKKYGTSAEAVAALEAKIGTIPQGYDNLVAYVNDQISAVTGSFSSDEVSGISNGVEVHIGQADGNVTAVTVTAPDFANTYAGKSDFESLSGAVSTIEGDYLDSTDKSEIDAAIAAETAAREAVSADTRLAALEGISADTRIAELEAVSADTRLDTLEASAHTHENKTVLDGITAQQVQAWDDMADGAVVVLSAYTGSDAGLTEGYLKTYEIFQGGNSVGKIDIPKDLVVSSGQIVEEGGVKYLRLTIANSSTPVDIAVSDLVDVYTPGNGIEISNSNEVSAKVVNANGLSVDANGIAMGLADGSNNGAMSSADFTKLGTIEASAQTNVIETVKVDGTALTVTDKTVDITLPDYSNTYAPIALTGTVADNKTAFDNYTAATDGRLDALESDTHTHDNKSVLDGITAEKVAAWDGVAGSADTRIAELESASADTRLDALEAISADTRIAELETASADTRLDALEAISADTRLDALESLTASTNSALQSISAADNSVAVGAKDASNNQTVGVKISATANNALSLNNDGLFAAIYYDGDDSE